ncbi:MAG: T9SS type A sorting domain-containing protein [Chitinophagales bacterium]
MKLTHNTKHYLWLCLTMAFFCLQTMLTAQSNFVQRTDIPLNNDETGSADLAWLGGLNNPQFSTADFNNDGIKDLFIFDRSSNLPICLINNGTPNEVDYEYVPKYAKNIPVFEAWALMHDYNCDGIADLFCSHQGDGIWVYEGSYNTNNELIFEISYNKLYADNLEGEPILLAVASYDIPAITDVDNDGDTDILTFQTSGGYVIFFQNQAVETGEPCTLDFAIETSCWGNFYESGIEEALELGVGCDEGLDMPQVEMKQEEMHPGSTLLAIDLDGDNDKEMMLGDISFDNLVMVTNGGTPEVADMTEQDVFFPSYNNSAILESFPAAFSVDVNNDNLDDLLVSPNAVVQSQHYNCVWLYENNGQANQQFSFQKEVFLIDEMIDVSERANPAFFDHNGDGLIDIVVANKGYKNDNPAPDEPEFVSTLALYENIGTAEEPAFTLISADYATVSAQFTINRTDLNPAFGDLDGDGDSDMLLGDRDGYIHFFRNNEVDGIANFEMPPAAFEGERFQDLDINQYASPFLVDINRDGLLDLLVGQRNGEIYYFENTGSTENPIFTQVSNYWGEVDVQEFGDITGHAIPNIVEFNGSYILLVGNEAGYIQYYKEVEQNLNEGAFELVTENLLGVDIGKNASPALADLNNDGFLDMVVGTNRGGLLWFEYDETVGINDFSTPKTTMNIYPNPAENNCFLSFETTKQDFAQLNIYHINGQKIWEQKLVSHQKTHQIDLENLTTGIYFFEAVGKSGVATQKVLIK